jgi:hypothetical protein
MNRSIRKLLLLIPTLLAIVVLLHCDATDVPQASALALQDAPACGGQWNPTWQQTSFANEWWVEYVVSDPNGGRVTSVSLDVMGGPSVPLTFMYNLKWTGPSPQRIPQGRQVTIHAMNSLGQSARTQPFGYLSAMPPLTDCSSADAGGGQDSGSSDSGTCDWNPTWQQTNFAHDWWVEYVISAPAGGTVTGASLDVVGGIHVPLTFVYGLKWVGPTSGPIPRGTQVIAHATNSLGQNASTQPFAYLSVMDPLTDCSVPCVRDCRGRGCGDDGCGGSCGSCRSGTTCQEGFCASPECKAQASACINNEECCSGECCGTAAGSMCMRAAGEICTTDADCCPFSDGVRCCAGICTNIQNDALNCNGCGIRCAAGTPCLECFVSAGSVDTFGMCALDVSSCPFGGVPPDF